MKKGRLHINRLLSVMMLWVFAIALTPFGALHHHEEEEELHCVKNEKTCSHKVHVRNHVETCLICAAHFEKDYLHEHTQFVLYKVSKPIIKHYAIIRSSYVELIDSALRGPPIA